jgi:uncharacterized membrane protein YidH (DUF202 family)
VDPRPHASFNPALQHERTALAWERTAISVMVMGVALARVSAVEEAWALALVGMALAAAGGAVLVWAGLHYDDLHGPLRRGDDVVHPLAARLLGIMAMLVSAAGLALGAT